jgi:ligand-binding sensor domain-containing protein
MMIKNLFLLHVLISAFFVYPIFPQTPSFYHYTTNDGLASSTVFNIKQDRNGFIWFGTLNGASKFDGKRFITFTTNQGLNSNTITDLVEGDRGELYFSNYEKGLNVLRNGKIENYCSEINGKSFATSYLLLVPSGKYENKIYAYRSMGGVNVIDEKIPFGQTNYVINPTNAYIYKLAELSSGAIIALTTTGLYNFNNGSLSQLHIKGFPDSYVYSYAEGNRGSYFIGTKSMIYCIKNNIVIKSYKIDVYPGKNDVVSLLKDKNNNLWFSIMNRGFFLIPNGSDNIIDIGKKMGLQNTLVNNFLEDNERNIWISTFGKGVYCLNNLYLRSYNENDGLSNNNIYSIDKEKSGRLIIGTFNGINIWENGKCTQLKNSSANSLSDYIHSIKIINDNIYVCASVGGHDNIFNTYKGLKFIMFDQPSFCRTKNGLYLFGTWVNSILIQSELKTRSGSSTQYCIFGDSAKSNRINEIFEDAHKNIWIGSNLGVCKLSNLSVKSGKTDWRKTFFADNLVLNSRINSISQDNENNLWFTGEKGIATFNPKNDSVKYFTNIFGYDLSNSTSIAIDSKNRIWIGNMRGLFMYDGKTIKQLSKQTGLPSDEIYSLCFDKGKNYLYIGTSNGISFLDVNLFDKNVTPSPNVRIFSIKAGDSVYTSFNNLVFEPEQHNVYIDFKALDFSSPGSVKYKYYLNGVWAETDNDFLDFISLEKGKYDLQIMAKSQNVDWGKPYILSFRILPRFVETIWFNILIIILLVSLSVIILTWRLKFNNIKIRKELEVTERINELKHHALSAMMNPHFIFNSLNSVQYLINCQRNEEANDYIAIMAKLIRKNLDTAGNGFILLSDEISRLKLYLDLEKLRFQDKFSYEINTGTEVNTDSILIPNMIIQPFVENSLWHGIINSGNKGILTVSFTFADIDIESVITSSLIIRITDNGIGILQASKNKKEDHISKGIQIIEERLRLLSSKMQLPQPIMFEDLSSRDNNSHGTEIIISLPQPLYKIISPESDSPSSLSK